MYGGTKWINSLNRNVNVSIDNKFELKRNIHKLVSIEFDVLNLFFFNQFYTFPNEDICLFKDFSHTQLVLPLLVLNANVYNAAKECSCTLIWLVQNYKYFFNSQFRNYIFLTPYYKD